MRRINFDRRVGYNTDDWPAAHPLPQSSPWREVREGGDLVSKARGVKRRGCG